MDRGSLGNDSFNCCLLESDWLVFNLTDGAWLCFDADFNGNLGDWLDASLLDFDWSHESKFNKEISPMPSFIEPLGSITCLEDSEILALGRPGAVGG